MTDIVKRKCAVCNKMIEINCNDIKDVVLYKNKYYHKDCFIKVSTERIARNNRYSQTWQDALDDIKEYEDAAAEKTNYQYYKNLLNEYLIKAYDITCVPSSFWPYVSDLHEGKYRNSTCKPIKIDMLYNMWKWGQKNLNRIHAMNKTKNRGPNNATGRLKYDLAILMNHTDDYIKSTRSNKEEKESIVKRIQNANKINYKKTYEQSSYEQHSDDNILDLMDEIF